MARRITNLPACHGVLAMAALEVGLSAGPVRVRTQGAGELIRLNALLEDPAVTRRLVIARCGERSLDGWLIYTSGRVQPHAPLSAALRDPLTVRRSATAQ